MEAVRVDWLGTGSVSCAWACWRESHREAQTPESYLCKQSLIITVVEMCPAHPEMPITRLGSGVPSFTRSQLSLLTRSSAC